MPFHIIDEIEIYYEIHGKGDPLLLLHGLGSSTRDWDFQIDQFSRHFQVINMDLRGHGQSGKPPGPYSVPLFANDAARLLKALGAEPANILGISLGGMVALQLAGDHPNLCKSLVVVNSTPDMKPKTLKDRYALWKRFLVVQLMGMRKMGQVLGGRFFPEPEQAAIREVFIDHWAENDKPAYLEAMKAVVGWSVLERLGEIRCPTLVLGADGDYFPTADKEAYTRLIPNASLEIIPNSRHALPAEKPEKFNGFVLDFLSGLTF
ncbi:MAG: alpha/beta fold hydrolase [Chloroflexi bacterium]|nr:alpha/beta fold hydrolase [Chloroflexota bacterium]